MRVMKIRHFYLGFLLLSCSCSYPSGDYTDDLGDGYIFVSESNANQFIYDSSDTSGKNVISCTVEAFAFDQHYIIAKQKNNPDCFQKELSKVSSSYWIISKKEKLTYGPLNTTEFVNKRAQLSVSTSLDLKE